MIYSYCSVDCFCVIFLGVWRFLFLFIANFFSAAAAHLGLIGVNRFQQSGAEPKKQPGRSCFRSVVSRHSRHWERALHSWHCPHSWAKRCLFSCTARCFFIDHLKWSCMITSTASTITSSRSRCAAASRIWNHLQVVRQNKLLDVIWNDVWKKLNSKGRHRRHITKRSLNGFGKTDPFQISPDISIS